MSDGRPVIQHTDVVIVGAGPAGLATALKLGQFGIRDFILVDRQSFPRDKTCGSAITPAGIRVLQELGVYDAVAARSHHVRGAKFDLPRGRQYRLDAPMLVCARRVLDQALLDRVLETSGIFVPNFNADCLLQRGDRVLGVRSVDGCEIHARHTVVANGVHSKFAPERGEPHRLTTIMGWWETAAAAHDVLEVVYDPTLSPFYGWRFPEGPTRVNIGIGYEDPRCQINARDLFAGFLERHYKDFLVNAQQIGAWKGQPLSPSFKAEKLTSSGRIVVGEAGRLVNPATGEGISQALYSGVLAAQALRQILCGKADPVAAYLKYEADCAKAFNGSFRFGRMARWFLGHKGLDALSIIPRRVVVSVCNNIMPSL